MNMLEVRLPRMSLGVIEAMSILDFNLLEHGTFEKFNIGG